MNVRLETQYSVVRNSKAESLKSEYPVSKDSIYYDHDQNRSKTSNGYIFISQFYSYSSSHLINLKSLFIKMIKVAIPLTTSLMPILNMNQISCQLNIFSRQIYVQGQVRAIIFSKVHIFKEGHKN